MEFSFFHSIFFASSTRLSFVLAFDVIALIFPIITPEGNYNGFSQIHLPYSQWIASAFLRKTVENFPIDFSMDLNQSTEGVYNEEILEKKETNWTDI